MATSIWFWVLFNAFVLLLLALDLGVFHRRAHEIRFREAVLWSVAWVAVALLFGAWLWNAAGRDAGLAWYTGYLVEKALSVDNIFVFVMIFLYFGVPPKYQHRVLFWGILGALVMRGIFIAVGAMLLASFHWVVYVFGGILLITGAKMAFREDKPFDGSASPVVRLAHRVFPVTEQYDGQRFFTRERGRLMATPLFVVVILIEVSDLVFAVDSIPAIFAITQDPFIVYTSNVFAILGLRAMYFVLASLVGRLYLLRFGLAAILVFVGIKMMLVDVFRIPVVVSLGVIGTMLASSVLASLAWPAPASAGKGAVAKIEPEPEAGADAAPEQPPAERV
ncbi:MAG TPA: TerC family protein [Gemmatimonadaceae bacterium]|nr:TerC family protein [Gemmatimonadaceae bacterium]